MTRRLLLLGGAGVFGSRIARLLAGTVDAELVLAGRDPARVAALAAELRLAGATSRPLALEREGGGFAAAGDVTVSPSYLPDLVHAALDLLLDREAGLWHLAGGG